MSVKLRPGMRRFLRVLIIIFVVIGIFAAGSFVTNRLLDNQIKKLSSEYDYLSTEAEKLRAEIAMTDEQSESDKIFLNRMFNEIFTFSNLEEFKNAKLTASADYNLPDYFVSVFYDMSELSGGYADAMLDVLLKYDYSNLYLLERDENGIGYYIADVHLSLVKYSGDMEIVMFISLAGHGSAESRVRSMTYRYVS